MVPLLMMFTTETEALTQTSSHHVSPLLDTCLTLMKVSQFPLLAADIVLRVAAELLHFVFSGIFLLNSNKIVLELLYEFFLELFY